MGIKKKVKAGHAWVYTIHVAFPVEGELASRQNERCVESVTRGG